MRYPFVMAFTKNCFADWHGRFRKFLRIALILTVLSGVGHSQAVARLATDDSADWHFASPRIALLGDSLLVSSLVCYYPESVVGDGKTLVIKLKTDRHIIEPGSKIKLLGFDKEVSSEFFDAAHVEGKNITVKSSFTGTAKAQFYIKAACATLQPGYGYVAQVLKRATDGRPLCTVTVPAMIVGSNSRDARVRMDYELMPFVDYFDVALIQLGTNDMSTVAISVDEYIRNIEKIITRLRGAGKKVVLGEIPPILPSSKDANAFSYRILLANKRLNELAKKLNVPLLNFYSALSDGIFANEAYMSDAHHPNEKGYAIMADIFYAHAKKYFY